MDSTSEHTHESFNGSTRCEPHPTAYLHPPICLRGRYLQDPRCLSSKSILQCPSFLSYTFSPPLFSTPQLSHHVSISPRDAFLCHQICPGRRAKAVPQQLGDDFTQRARLCQIAKRTYNIYLSSTRKSPIIACNYDRWC